MTRQSNQQHFASGAEVPPLQPSWLLLAQQHGWVAKTLPKTDREPSFWLIAVLLVLLLICGFAVMGLGWLLMSETLRISQATWYVMAGLIWLRSGWALRVSSELIPSSMATVGVLVGSIWLSMSTLGMIDDGMGLLSLSLIQTAAMLATAWLARSPWVTRLLGSLAAVWLGLGWTESHVLAEEPWVKNSLAWGTCTLLAVLLIGWSSAEQRLLNHRYAAKGAALLDGLSAGLLLVVPLWDWLQREAHGSSVLLPMHGGAPTWLAPLIVAGALWFWIRRWQPGRSGVMPVLSAQTRLTLRDGADFSGRAGLNAPVLSGVLGLGLVLVPGAFVQVWLAPVVALAAMAAVTGRWRLLLGTGVLALWLLSRFYYDLGWSLSEKALMLGGLGGLLLALLCWQQRQTKAEARSRSAMAAVAEVPVASSEAMARSSRSKLAAAVVVLGAAACFVLLNVDVARKEQVVQQGERLRVPLAPVDPRSLMQGDYMALRFDIAAQVREALNALPGQAMLRQVDAVVALNDGQARIVRLAQPGEVLAANERRMPLKRLKSTWVLVTDAYFFPEGDAKRFESARFGEFRILPDGRALLVGLSDAQGQAIASSHDLRRPMW